MATNISLSPNFPGYGETLTGKFTLVRMELLGVDAYPIASSSDDVIYTLRPILGMNSLECFYDGGNQFISVVSSTITDESAVTTVSDPSSVISSTAFEDVGLNRGLRVFTTSNSGTAQLEWTWNSVTVTVDVSVA